MQEDSERISTGKGSDLMSLDYVSQTRKMISIVLPPSVWD